MFQNKMSFWPLLFAVLLMSGCAQSNPGAPDALNYQAYLARQLESITDIGTISEPNLEIITLDATPAAGNSLFPITIEHKFGSTVIPAAPQQVISLGFSDQDPILALGIKPIAVRHWFGEQPHAVWPWARAALGDAEPVVLTMPFGELNFETIAALQPELISGVSAGMSDEEYVTLSQIAPTLAQSDAYVNFGVPWHEQTQVIGRALGQEALAHELVAEMEARFAQTQAAHPEFSGATTVIAAPAADGQFYFSGPQHERQRFLTSLGFVLPDELVQIAGDAFYGTISGERLDLLDTDILIWTATPEQRTAIEQNPVYQQLAVVREGRVIFLDTTGNADMVGPALVFSSVLSLPVAFDELVPQLASTFSSTLEGQE